MNVHRFECSQDYDGDAQDGSELPHVEEVPQKQGKLCYLVVVAVISHVQSLCSAQTTSKNYHLFHEAVVAVPVLHTAVGALC